ncbi:hypothetical protein DFS34DRAFT_4984 [Phlyctochytrium arcticum]|nr:hypothetical protein DFS34DRAFT_4984 [Phlyctochytrium arcticum]
MSLATIASYAGTRFALMPPMAESSPDSRFCDWRVDIHDCQHEQTWRDLYVVMTVTYAAAASLAAFLLGHALLIRKGRFFKKLGGWGQPRPFECFLGWMTISCAGHSVYGILVLLNVLESEVAKELWQSWPWNCAQVAVVLYYFGIMHATPALDNKSISQDLGVDPIERPFHFISSTAFAGSPRTMFYFTSICSGLPAILLIAFSILIGFARDHKWTSTDTLLSTCLLIWSLTCLITAGTVWISGRRLTVIIRDAMQGLSLSGGVLGLEMKAHLDRSERTLRLMTLVITMLLVTYAIALIFLACFKDRILQEPAVSILFAVCWWLLLPVGLCVLFICLLFSIIQGCPASDNTKPTLKSISLKSDLHGSLAFHRGSPYASGGLNSSSPISKQPRKSGDIGLKPCTGTS